MIRRPAACVHEREVLDLIAIGQWPARADEPLRAHAAGCAICREVAEVAAALSALAEVTAAGVNVPDASVVWHRAAARRRHERARQAARPMTVVFVASIACALAAAGAAAWLAWAAIAPWGIDTARGVAASAAGAAAWTASSSWRWAAAGLGAWMAALPVAAYLARAADRRSPAIRTTPAARRSTSARSL